MDLVSTSFPRSLSELGRSVKKQPTKSTPQRDQAQVAVVKLILHIPNLYPCFSSNVTWVTCFLCYGHNFLSLLSTTLGFFVLNGIQSIKVRLPATSFHLAYFCFPFCYLNFPGFQLKNSAGFLLSGHITRVGRGHQPILLLFTDYGKVVKQSSPISFESLKKTLMLMVQEDEETAKQIPKS